jgi:hypothetical protein
MEAIGDITASAEVSQVPVHGREFETRLQGGILVRPYTHYVDSCTKHRTSGRWHRRLPLSSLYCNTSLSIRPEQWRHRHYSLCEPRCREVVLFLPHPVRHHR